METETRTIDSDEADDLHNDSKPIGDWSKVCEQYIDNSRWYDQYWLVLRHADGTYWGLEYEIGRTEMQENFYPWRGVIGPLPLTRLYPHEVASVEYRTTPTKDAI